MNVMFYDRNHEGGKRLNRNIKLVKDLLNGAPLNIEGIDRSRPFLNQKNAEDILLNEGGILYDAIIINSTASEAQEVIKNAMFGFEYHQKDKRRIIVLGGPGPEKITYLPMNGAGGYMNPADASTLLDTLVKFAEQTKPGQ